jgi:hypothetical protein
MLAGPALIETLMRTVAAEMGPHRRPIRAGVPFVVEQHMVVRSRRTLPPDGAGAKR